MRTISILTLAAGLVACQPAETPMTDDDPPISVAPDIEARLARFAPTELEADLSGVPAEELPVLVELIRAARLMDEIFLRQVAVGNPARRQRAHAIGGAVATYFDVNFGPWDRLDEMEPFLGDEPHPEGAGYYPTDLTRDEFAAWLEAHPQDREAFEGLHTVIRRDGERLVARPYSEVYAEWLEPAAAHLRAAAATTGNATLRRFLDSRAVAFATDDYYQSDIDWMDLEAPVEVTIGPYEVYEDGLFAYKAAFEGFVTVDLPRESANLERFKALLPWLERNLPIDDRHKNLDRGTDSPIKVVDAVFVGGDSKAGVQTLAFNLPNDERVREAKGSKKVLLRNVMRAKYDQILVPIADRVVAAEQVDDVSFDAYLAEVLHHELSHGLGPGTIEVDGRETEVRLELKELYSTLEEAKADVMGIYNILALIDRGDIAPAMRATLEPTYLAGLFRSARFGLHEAHGRGVVSQFNYLLEKGGLEVDDGGRFRVVSDAFPGAIESLLGEMLMLQATGDYDGTATFLDTYGVATPELETAIERLSAVPVDIRPIYRQAEALLSGAPSADLD